MLVSSRGRYALRIMAALARKDPQSLTPLKDLAQEEGISLKYLESIMASLRKVGFVDATQGKNGGYRLNRPPRDYTVGMILTCTEEKQKAVECLPDCQRSGNCPTRPLWMKLEALLGDFFESVTLQDLLES